MLVLSVIAGYMHSAQPTCTIIRKLIFFIGRNKLIKTSWPKEYNTYLMQQTHKIVHNIFL